MVFRIEINEVQFSKIQNIEKKKGKLKNKKKQNVHKWTKQINKIK